jgi:hypothetical protein
LKSQDEKKMENGRNSKVPKKGVKAQAPNNDRKEG